MKKLRLLLLDAGIVFALHELGLWDRIVDLCDVNLSRTVLEVEVKFYRGTKADELIDLSPARVQVLLGYVRGSPEYRLFCIECADRHPARAEPEADFRRRWRPSLGSLLILAGIVIVAMAALASEVGATG